MANRGQQRQFVDFAKPDKCYFFHTNVHLCTCCDYFPTLPIMVYLTQSLAFATHDCNIFLQLTKSTILILEEWRATCLIKHRIVPQKRKFQK